MIRAFWTACVLALPLVMGLGLAACSLAPEWAGGDAGESMDLEGDHTVMAEMEVGESLTLEFRSPEPGGYELAGIFFDAVLLDMTSFLTLPDEDGPGRLQYVFTALAPGQAMIEIRVRARDVPDAPVEVYKRVLVTIEE